MKNADTGLSRAKAVEKAWRATSTVLAYTESLAEQKSLRALAEMKEEKARPALAERDQAARRFARGLLAIASEAAAVAEEQARLATEHRELRNKAQTAAYAATGAAATAESEAAQLNRLVAGVEKDIAAAVAEGLLPDASSLPEKTASTQQEFEVASGRIDALERERDELAEEESKAQGNLRQAVKAVTELRQQSGQLAAEIQEATGLTQELESEPRLAELLEVDWVHLEGDTEALLTRLAEARSDLERERTELKVAESVDERARLALADGDLLPPPQAVTDACGALSEARINAVLGWKYLADIPNLERRQEIIAAVPHLAAGVLLNDPADIDEARRVLAELQPCPTIFIAVATTRTFADSAASTLPGVEIVVPPHPALYDPEAAAAEHLQIEARHVEREQRLTELTTRSETDSTLTHRISDWRRRYPVGAIAALTEKSPEAVRRCDAAEIVVGEREETLGLLIARREAIGAQLPALREIRTVLQTRGQRLNGLLKGFTSLPEWTAKANTASAHAEEQRQLAADSEAKAILLGDQAEEHERTADEHRRTVRSVNEERLKLPGSEEVSYDEPLPGLSVGLLRSAYQGAVERYLKVQVGSDLLAQLSQAEKNAGTAKAEYDPLLESVRTEATRLLSEPDGVDEASRAAAQERAARAVATAEAAKPRTPSPPMPSWHPDVYWLAREWPTATPKQRAAYVAINTWLMGSPDLFAVPLRERALEIFGEYGSEADFPVPEKTFDTLRSGPLFSDRSQLHEVLRTFTSHPPLMAETFTSEVGDGYYQRIGTGDVLLVVENSATWWSLVHSLPDGHRLGYIAWGLGGTFRASINTITAKHRVAEIRYFGDLDLSGVRIPYAASQTAVERGLPPVRPTWHLYGALLKLGKARGGKEKEAGLQEASELAQWLPAQHREKAIELMTGGKRMAQEWVGYRFLSRSGLWYPDIW